MLVSLSLLTNNFVVVFSYAPPPQMHQSNMYHQSYPPQQTYGYAPMHYQQSLYTEYAPTLVPQPPVSHLSHAPLLPVAYPEQPRQSPLPVRPRTFSNEDLKT